MKIVKRYRGASLSNLPEGIATDLRQLGDSRKSFYLYGDVGVGKTYAVYAFANFIGLDNIRVFNVPDVLRSIRTDINRPEDEKAAVVAEISPYGRYVAFDDIGVEKASDWAVETLYGLINERYEQVLPTIFTSNLSPSQLSSRLGKRIASRIIEMCEVIELVGEDKRTL